MKEFLTKYRLTIIFCIIGAIGGFLYWRFVGCASGTCPITSHWYTMCAYGILMGGLVGELFMTKRK